MPLMESYILRRITVMFFAVLGAAVGITWVVQVLQRINFLTTSGQSFFSILKFSSLLLPSVIPLVMPFALIIAITQTLSTMNQDSELVVINASGASRSTIVRPVMLLAIIVAIVSFLISNFVGPQARVNMRTMLTEISSDILNVVIQEGSFRQLGDNIYVQIAERKPDGQIGGLFIADSRDPNIDYIYYAVDGSIAVNDDQSFLLMKNGEVQRRDLKTGDVSIIKFDTYSFDLSQFSGDEEATYFYAKDRSLPYLLNPDPSDPIFQTRPQTYTLEIHKRFTAWLYPIVFAVIALVFTGDSRSHREARMSASFTAISSAMVVYWAGYYISEAAYKDLSLMIFAYLIPLSVIAFGAYILISGRSVALPLSWQRALARLTDHILAIVLPLRNRLIKNNKNRGDA